MPSFLPSRMNPSPQKQVPQSQPDAVAPGPVWTPLIPASFQHGEVSGFGTNTLMKRAGQPSGFAPAFVFLACNDASFITGQTIHINGGGFISA